MESLPVEVLCNIFGNLGRRQLIELSLLSKDFYHPAQRALRGFLTIDPSAKSLSKLQELVSNEAAVKQVHSIHIKTTTELHVRLS